MTLEEAAAKLARALCHRCLDQELPNGTYELLDGDVVRTHNTADTLKKNSRGSPGYQCSADAIWKALDIHERRLRDAVGSS